MCSLGGRCSREARWATRCPPEVLCRWTAAPAPSGLSVPCVGWPRPIAEGTLGTAPLSLGTSYVRATRRPHPAWCPGCDPPQSTINQNQRAEVSQRQSWDPHPQFKYLIQSPGRFHGHVTKHKISLRPAMGRVRQLLESLPRHSFPVPPATNSEGI